MALMWQSLISSGGATDMGKYEPLLWLPRKAAIFLFEYHDGVFRGKVPGLPLLPPPQDRDEFLGVHDLVKKTELRGLLSTLSIRQAESGQGHFRLFRTLEIGHQVYHGHQRVHCSPFETYYGANRQDFVFVRPAEAAAEGFAPTPDNVLHCKVLLLFDMEADTDSGPKQYKCAYVSLLQQLKPRQPDPYAAVRGPGARVIYEHDENVSHIAFAYYEKKCV
jgi:hypothetical protein